MPHEIDDTNFWTLRVCRARHHDLLPLGDLHRVQVKIFGDLLDEIYVLERFERHAGLEFGAVSSAFGFHFSCVWFGFTDLTRTTQS
jgi:hypothetical protein